MIRIISAIFAIALFAWVQVAPADAQWVQRKKINGGGVNVAFGDCPGCDFSDRILPKSLIKQRNLSATLFNRSNLSGSRIYETNFTGAHFKHAFLASVRGRQVILQGANMTDVFLTETILNDSSFSGATMTGADMARCAFLNSNFNGAKLQNAKALATDFSGSHFVHARLDEANLTGANFSNTVLKNVEFGKAQLQGTYFQGAQLQGANLSNAKGLTQSQLDLACGNAKTQLPIGLSVPYCMTTGEDHIFAPHQPEHPKLAEREREIAQRIDRSIANIENLMQSAQPAELREMEKIHSDLKAVQRKVEE